MSPERSFYWVGTAAIGCGAAFIGYVFYNWYLVMLVYHALGTAACLTFGAMFLSNFNDSMALKPFTVAVIYVLSATINVVL